MIRGACAVLALAFALGASPAEPRRLSLRGYQQPGGAITVSLNADAVDPYFAAKALLAAQQVSLDATAAARAWIAWIMPFQHEDGRFERMCRSDGRFVRCAPADADDAAMALWMELLVRFAPARGLPAAWRASFDRAERHLAKLQDRRSGVFHISRQLPVALFMDNVEIYAAFRAIGRYHARRGERARARAWEARAEALRKSIVRVFFSAPGARFFVSTQPSGAPAFYPDEVAQLFPILGGMPAPTGPERTYAEWMHRNRETWLRHAETDFPWGLVALVAAQMRDVGTVRCWLARAQPFRHGPHWNVLEEVLYHALHAWLPSSPRSPTAACAPEAVSR